MPNAGWPFQRLPVFDMIETSERTSSGRRAASVWAIMPPIEAPTMWAGASSELAQQPGGVVCHVAQVVEDRIDLSRQQLARRGRGAVDPGRAADVAVVEADHLESASDQLLAELVGPADHLACRGP